MIFQGGGGSGPPVPPLDPHMNCVNCRCFCVELVKLLPVHQYSLDIFSYSGPSGILGSDGKQNTTFGSDIKKNNLPLKWELGGVRIGALLY